MQILTAPVVPWTKPHQWEIIHGDQAPSGRKDKVAYTTRGGRDLGYLSAFPHSKILVLDEAWPLKFDSECLPLNSVRDGLRVLTLLLHGKFNQLQQVMWFRGSQDSSCEYHDVCSSYERWSGYVCADASQWVPHGEIDSNGVLHTSFDDGGVWHSLMSRKGDVVGHVRDGDVRLICSGSTWDSYHFQGEVKLVYSGTSRETWVPSRVHRDAPRYVLL